MKLCNENMSEFYFTDMGSTMLNWYPIISDTVDDKYEYINGLVFINLNPDDKNYKKICLLNSDDHGRVGCYILYDEKYTLEYILTLLKKICDYGKTNYSSDDEYDSDGSYESLNSGHYSSPLVILMDHIGLSVIYG